MATAMAIRNGGMPLPAGVIALSPWADLTLSGWSIMRNAESDAALAWDLLFVSARNYLNGANPADPYASPVFGSMRDFPPIMNFPTGRCSFSLWQAHCSPIGCRPSSP